MALGRRAGGRRGRGWNAGTGQATLHYPLCKIEQRRKGRETDFGGWPLKRPRGGVGRGEKYGGHEEDGRVGNQGGARQAASLTIRCSTSPFERGDSKTSPVNEGDSEHGWLGNVDDGEEDLEARDRSPRAFRARTRTADVAARSGGVQNRGVMSSHSRHILTSPHTRNLLFRDTTRHITPIYITPPHDHQRVPRTALSMCSAK